MLQAEKRERVPLPSPDNLVLNLNFLEFTSTSVRELVCKWCEMAWLALHSWWLKQERSKKNLRGRSFEEEKKWKEL